MERELAKSKGADPPSTSRAGNGDGNGKDKQRKVESRATQLAQMLFSPVFVEAFILTFLAEWGDRSQIATIGKRMHGLLALLA